MTILVLMFPVDGWYRRWITVCIPRVPSQQLLTGNNEGGEGILAIYQWAAESSDLAV